MTSGKFLKNEAEKRSKDWLMKAFSDLQSAKKMIKIEVYDWSTFLCQQSLEKLLKGLYILEKQKFPLHIHHLDELARLLNEKPPQDLLDKMRVIDKFYLPSRYPEERLSEKKWESYFTKKYAQDLYKNTKEVFLWYLKENSLKI